MARYSTLNKLTNQLIKVRAAIQLQRRHGHKPSIRLVTQYNWIKLQIEMFSETPISFA